ncbi:MAG: sulfatase-like hydrolase/transferase [Myxococcota bacterium]|nr:sulfatase-like hydrolase/transferase [Myxococcota bacterium]
MLLIVLDDLGYGDTSLSALSTAIQEHVPDWEPDIQTPSLEAFSTEGVSLTRFRTDAPVCAPTRAALMTGLSPHSAGFWSAHTFYFGAEYQLGLRPGLVLLPEVLSDAGVSTSMVGKWHLGFHTEAWDPTGGEAGCLAPDTPDARGFERVFGFLSSTHDYSIGVDCGELVEGGAGQALSSLAADGGCPHVGEHTTELFTERALAELNTLQSAGEPWFLYVAYNAPHTPVDSGAAWIRAAASSDHPDAARYTEMIEACEELSNRNSELTGRDYCLLVSHLDLHLGRLLDAAPEHALVIVMSDNGGLESVGASNAHFRDNKGSVFNGGMVVPMLARGPELPAGIVLDTSITSAELFPTILDFIGVAAPEAQHVSDFPESCEALEPVEVLPLVATSRLEALQGKTSSSRVELFLENSGQVALLWQDEESSGGWKLVADLLNTTAGVELPYCSPSWELYDQHHDPEELSDVFETEPARAQEMLDAVAERLVGLPYIHDDIQWHVCCFEAGMSACTETCGECMTSE